MKSIKTNRFLDITAGQAVLTVYLICASVMLFCVHQFAVNLLIWDQWDFYDGLFLNKSWGELFRWQHGPHRQGIGFWVIRALAEWTHWDARAEAYASAAFFIAGCGIALLLKKRLFSRWSYTDMWIPPLLLQLSYWESLFGKPNLSHAAVPFFLIFLFVLATTLKNNFVRLCGLLTIDGLAIYTGFGLMLGVIAPLYFLLEATQNKKQGLLAVVTSVLLLLSFFYDYHATTAVSCFRFPDPQPLKYITFLASEFSMLAGFYGLFPIALIPGTIILVSLACLFVSVLRKVLSKQKTDKIEGASPVAWRACFVLIAVTLIFAVNSAVGRACLGPAAGFSSRYVPYLLPGALAGYFLLLIQPKSIFITRLRQILAFTLLFNLFIGTPGFFRKVPQIMRARESWKQCYLIKRDLRGCTLETGTEIHPAPTASHILEKLDYLSEHRLNLFKPHPTAFNTNFANTAACSTHLHDLD